MRNNYLLELVNSSTLKHPDWLMPVVIYQIVLVKNLLCSENIFNRSALGQIGCESLFSTINILKRFALQIRFHVWNQDFVWRLDHGILGSSS